MNIKPQTVQALLRLYPAEWRAEYGEELASLLSLQPITPHVFVDVVRSAVHERLRREAWKVFGALLVVLTVLGIVVNNTTPLSREGYELYKCLWGSMVLLAGCLTFVLNHGASPSRAAAKAALIGFIPEIIALALWSAGIFHPLVIKGRGADLVFESRLTLFHVIYTIYNRQAALFPTTFMAPRLVYTIPSETLFVLVGAGVIGFLGGLLGKMILFLSPRCRPC